MTGQPAYTDADVTAAAEALRLWDDERITYPEQATAALDAVVPGIVARAKAEALREAATLVDDAAQQELGMGAAQRSILRRADEIEAGR